MGSISIPDCCLVHYSIHHLPSFVPSNALGQSWKFHTRRIFLLHKNPLFLNLNGFEVASLVLGAIPLLISALEHYRNRLKFLSAFEVESPWPSARRQNLRDEYGRIITWLLPFTYPNTLDDMEQIEKNVLGAEDKNAIIFKISFSFSLNMIAVAVSLSITHSPGWVLKSQHCLPTAGGNHYWLVTKWD